MTLRLFTQLPLTTRFAALLLALLAAGPLAGQDHDVREPLKPLTGEDLVDAEFPGSWPMFGKTTRMKVGGYVKADFVYDVDGTLDRTQFLMSTIPVEGTPDHDRDGYVSFFARETRFNIDVRRVSGDKRPLRAFIEGDFWSSGNLFRLRHAYLTYGNFIVGQTWTNLSILESIPILIDFAAGDALFGGRTTQIRYQRRLNKHWQLGASLENLDFMGIENPGNLPGEPSAGLPLLALRADYSWKTGLLVLGGSVAQLRWDGISSAPNATATQADLVVAGRQHLGQQTFVTWNVSLGRGAGENIMAFAGSDANAVLNPSSGSLKTLPAVALLLGARHEWSPKLSSNLSGAYGWLKTPASRAPLALKQGGIWHLNMIWQMTEEASTGIEYMFGAQRVTDDSKGLAHRIQGMVRFDF